MKATKKPIEIDYLPYAYNLFEVFNWVKTFGDNFHDNFIFKEIPEQLFVKTLEGTSYLLTPDDVIIRGVKGEYYPYKKDIFEKTYNF